MATMQSSLGQSTNSRNTLTPDLAKTLLTSGGKGGSGSSTVDIHPVVLLHIADHHHRNVAQHGQKAQVFGALLGRQEGAKVEICFAFEILVDKVENRYVLDRTYWFLKEEQFKQILPGLEYVGWYTVADEYLSQEDLDLQNQFWEVSQNPLFLKAHGNKPDSFPIDLFESVVEFVAGVSTMKFAPVQYNIVFEQAEQIGVHHIATKADAEAAGSAGAETEYQLSMRSMSSAVRMLQERLSVISQYMAAVEAGTLPPDNEILIELKRIVELLQSLDSDEQQDKYNIMKLQAVMTASVGSYTQTVESLIEFVRKNAVLVERRGPMKGGPRFMPPQPVGLARGFMKTTKHNRPTSSKFKTPSIFTRNRGEDSSDGPRSSGSMGESSQ